MIRAPAFTSPWHRFALRLGGIAVAMVVGSGGGSYAWLGAVVIGLFGSGIVGTLLATRALMRKERWPWLGIVALLVNALPSMGLLIAIVIQRQNA